MEEREDKYIEYLDENGWHLILNDTFKQKQLRKRKRRIKVGIFLVLLCVFSLSFTITYSRYSSGIHGDSSIKVATWDFKINSDYNRNINIDLADTLIENNYSTTKVIPGTKGVIQLNIDFSGSKVATSYSILGDDSVTVVPENLKFYSDSEMTVEFTGFYDNIPLEKINQVVSKNIYWKWEFTDTDETVTWANKNIVLGLKVTGEQDI